MVLQFRCLTIQLEPGGPELLLLFCYSQTFSKPIFLKASTAKAQLNRAPLPFDFCVHDFSSVQDFFPEALAKIFSEMFMISLSLN